MRPVFTPEELEELRRIDAQIDAEENAKRKNGTKRDKCAYDLKTREGRAAYQRAYYQAHKRKINEQKRACRQRRKENEP